MARPLRHRSRIEITNIMLVSVTERTRDIGIQPAIGTLDREVSLRTTHNEVSHRFERKRLSLQHCLFNNVLIILD